MYIFWKLYLILNNETYLYDHGCGSKFSKSLFAIKEDISYINLEELKSLSKPINIKCRQTEISHT